ncbi:MAG: hypothetical protein KBG84_07465 [Planctomycetes bacterium]|nr:hypothetical protein [Planctomycetota bacterium]
MPTSGAENAGQNFLQPHIVETAPVPMQIARHMPVQFVNGRAKSFAVIGKLEPGVALGACLDYTLQDYEIEQATYVYGELVSAFQTCSTTQDITGGPNNLNNALRKKAERRLQQLFWELIDTGVAGSGSFLGLSGLLPAGQKVVVGGVPTLQQFDEALSLVVDNEAHPTAIMSNWGALKRYLALLRAAGLKPDLVETHWADPVKGVVRGKVISMYGTPWYINAAMTTRPEGTNIYFMVLGDNGEARPGHGLTMIMPAERMGNPYVEREWPMLKTDGSLTPTSTITRALHWPVGYALGSMGAVSMLENITPL